MSDRQSIEQTHPAQFVVTVEVEQLGPTVKRKLGVAVTWANWDSSDPNTVDAAHTYMVPMGDGFGGPGVWSPLADVLDDLFEHAERAAQNAADRLLGEGEGDAR